jgi:hypothetical protein
VTGWLRLGLACATTQVDPKPRAEGGRDSAAGRTDSAAGSTPSTRDTAARTDSGAGLTAALPRSLLEAEAFAQVATDPTPLAAHRPDPFFCDARGLTVEAGGVEVATDLCPYAALEAPLSVSLPAGSRLEIVLLTGDLIWVEPAEGHFALWLGEVALFDLNVPIPSPAGIYRHVVTLESAAAAGTRWHLHCHNHGANTWRLVDVLWTGVETP